ncbi:MAG TPA: ABC transporter ATP-binding protein [Verrucomicrobiae bacterium]|nr:ABC transporter ATP-binding protein [Verrucomicrobiae bacterium]
MSALQAEGITTGYGSVPVVSNVSMEAVAGEVVVLVGPNGAGKSTFLKGLFGLLRHTSGRVVVDGRDVSGWPPHRIARSGMAYVPQVSNTFPSMSVVENLEIGGFASGKDVRQRIDEVLAIFPDLARSPKARAGSLSGGQQNILGMARSLMLSPKVVLLDEPTAGLAPRYVGTVWEQVGRLAAAGTAVLVVEQNVDLAMRHSHRVYVLVAGRVRLHGTPAEVRQQDLTALFLGGAGPIAPADVYPHPTRSA